MRNVLLTVVCGIAVLSFAYFGNFLRGIYDSNKELLSPIIGISNSPKPQENKKLLEIDGYQIAWVEVEKLDKISLYPNLVDHKTAKGLYKEKGCKTLVNGGFYTDDDKHIGLLVSNGDKKSEFKENILFDGVINIGSNSAEIKSTHNGANTAIQSGPILALGGKPKKLSIKNDENERRMVVATTKNGEVIFLSIYKKDSAYIGPKLADVPKILEEFSRVTGIIPVSALNLDGGTASAFYTEGVSLGELTKIGSYFCVKD